MVGRLLFIILSICDCCFAIESGIVNESSKINESIPVVITKKPLSVDSNVINKVDLDSDNINTLKRKLEVEKVKADLKRTMDASDNTLLGKGFGETTVTSVYIEENGSKYATLQFVDGSTLDIEIGSLIGEYEVLDISMTGVTIRKKCCKKGKCFQKIIIKRLYSKINDAVTNNVPIKYMPTPEIMDKNTQMVPPIITNR
jgi:hypothetical protein